MKRQQIYYRRKDKSIVIEGKEDGASILIWTLPNDPTSLLEFLIKASYFEQEKADKITEKIKRLDSKPQSNQKSNSNVPLININRTTKKDASRSVFSGDEPSEEEIEASLKEAGVI